MTQDDTGAGIAAVATPLVVVQPQLVNVRGVSHEEGGYVLTWLREIGAGWSAAGMFTLSWFTSRSASNPTFQSTFRVGRDFTPSAASFVEYVGDYPDHLRPAQVIDAGRIVLGSPFSGRCAVRSV